MLVFICLTELRAEKEQTLIKNIVRQIKILPLPGQKIVVETYSRLPKPWRKSWRESAFGKSAYSKVSVYSREFRKPHTCPKQDMSAAKI